MSITLLLGALIFASGCAPLRFRCYEGRFGGLERQVQEAAKNNGATHFVLVHGMRNHSPGYGNTFANNIAERLHVLSNSYEERISLPLPEANSTNILRNLSYSSAENRIFFHELTWTPTTRFLKARAFAEDERLNSRRVVLNKSLKNKVINDGFGDAALYLNPSFQTNMQKPIRQSIEYVVQRAGSNDQIVLVASSLGSKMTFDAIEQWASTSADEFAARTTVVIMLANQVPLLNLGSREIKNGEVAVAESSLRSFLQRGQRRKARKIEEQKARGAVPEAVLTNTIHVIAATDPNDILSYPVRERDIPPPEDVDGKRIEVMGANIYSHNAWAIPWLFENPLSAHADYEANDWLLDQLVEGFQSNKECLPKAETTGSEKKAKAKEKLMRKF